LARRVADSQRQNSDATMAGIKRKSNAPNSVEAKTKSKKIKIDKPKSKRDSKSEVKPVKSKKVKESSEDLVESDTSEEENGFNGFSAAKDDDVTMGDTESSEGVDTDTPQQNGKTQNEHKDNSDASSSKLAGLNCKC